MMAAALVPAPSDPGAAVVARVTTRLVPFLFACYVVAYLDRVNLGFAATAFQRDLGLSNAVYGTGAGLFFLGYFVFEIPSNLILERVGARRWIARILIVWGLVSMAAMFAAGKWSFYGLRILLGLAEAGFFPGVLLYLTYWIPARERARTGALFMAAAPVAILIGAPLSSIFLALDGTLGLHGWQWLFLGEGLPAVILGFVALAWLTDGPSDADWLTPGERERLLGELRLEQARRASQGHVSLGQSIRSTRVWLLCAFYFLNTTVTYGVFLWLPKILQEASGARGARLAGLTAVPFAFALVAMVLVGRHSDRTRERRWHVAACTATAACGLLLAVAAGHHVALLVVSITLCQMGQRAVQPTFWAIPPLFLGGTAAAAGFALVNAVGNLGGYAGPTIMGMLRESSGGYGAGLLVLVCALLIQTGLVLSLGLPSAGLAGSRGSRGSRGSSG